MSDSENDRSIKLSSEAIGIELEKAAETTQLDERSVGVTVGGGLVPPYPPEYLANFQELNGTHAIAVGKKAQWEVGFGFDIVEHRSVGDDRDGEESQRESVRDFWFGSESRWKVGPEGTTDATPAEVFVLGRRDYHGIGWGAIEILTQSDGMPSGLAHIPATTVRVRKAETSTGDVIAGHGYVQKRDNEVRYFGEAGDRWRGQAEGDTREPIFVDQETGEIANDARDLENEPANELIFIPNPSPLSLHYGIPDWVAEIQTMSADQSAKRFNRDFFEWDALGQYAVIVEGGRLSEDSRDAVRGMIQDLREKEGRRVAVLEAEELAEAGIDIDSEASIRIEKLTEMGSEDMSFERFRTMNEHDIGKVHEVPPILLNRTESANRANSREQIRAFAEEVVSPEQERFASRLYNILHMQGLQAPDWTIEFHLRGADNAMRDAEVAATRIQGSQGVMKVNEARSELGLDTIDGPVGEQLLAELGGGGAPAGPGGGFQQAIDDMVGEAADGVREEVLAEVRSTTPVMPTASRSD